MTQTNGTNTDGGYIAIALATAPDAPEGFRLSRHIVKSNKDGTKKSNLPHSLAVFVPVRTLSAPFNAEHSALNNAFFAAVEGWEDDTIRAKLESGAAVIYSADLSLDRINEYLSSTPEGLGKLSAEKIRAWFASDLAEVLAKVLREKIGAAATDEKVTQTLNNYRDIFARLAEKSPSFAPEVIANLEKAIALAPQSPMAEKIAERLTKSAPKSVDLLAL